jgi:hypothetical protein
LQVVFPLPFIFIVDKRGVTVDVFDVNSKLDYIHDVVRVLNKNHDDVAPHVPWLYNGSTMSPLISAAPYIFTKETLH